MKKLVYIIAAIAAVLACAKESQNPQEPQPTNNDNTPAEVVDDPQTVHELFVTLPDDIATRAGISASDGSFSWTKGDKIAVEDDAGNVYPFEASEVTETPQSFRFTFKGSITGTLTAIHYPYIDTAPYYDDTMPRNLDSETAVLASSNIRLSGTIDGNSATLSHNHAFVRLKFENVPTFATKIKFYEDASATPTVVNLTGTGSVTAYLPVHDGVQTMTVALSDDYDNVILQKSHTYTADKAFAKGAIKNMKALTVGHVFTFVNNASWSNPIVTIWNGAENYDFKSVANDENATYPWKLNKRGDTETYYIVVNDDVINGNSHVFANDDYLGISFYGTGEGQSTLTNRVYQCRDIEFTIPSGGGMKTDYRIYIDSGDYVNAYAYYYDYAKASSTTFTIIDEVEMSPNYVYVFASDKDQDQHIDHEYYGWPGETVSNASFTLKEAGNKFTIILHNNNGWQTEDSILDLASGENYAATEGSLYVYSKGEFEKPGISFVATAWNRTSVEALGSWPGSNYSSSGYVAFSPTYYGATFNVIFSKEGGSDQTGEDNYTINQEYRKTF